MSLSLLADEATLSAVGIQDTQGIDAFGTYTATTLTTSYVVPVNGVSATSKVVAQLTTEDAKNQVRVVSAVAGTNTITITLSVAPLSLNRFSWVVLNF
jgi:hypothetical protein